MNIWKHFCTITKHKLLVTKYCFRVGLYKQGILHDLSKYSFVEFYLGAKYYQGDSSPHNGERAVKGYSAAWLHHKGRNKHHYEYWIDYSSNKQEGLVGMKMPVQYTVEMVLDRIAACKTYQKQNYTNGSPLKYYENSKKYYILHPETKALMELLFHMLLEDGEEKTFDYIKKNLL